MKLRRKVKKYSIGIINLGKILRKFLENSVTFELLSTFVESKNFSNIEFGYASENLENSMKIFNVNASRQLYHNINNSMLYSTTITDQLFEFYIKFENQIFYSNNQRNSNGNLTFFENTDKEFPKIVKNYQ